MIRQLYPASISDPAEYDYTDPVECFVCGEEFDRDGHEDQLFDLEGAPEPEAVICYGCDLVCAQCGHSVLVREGGTKFVEGTWIDGEPYHGDCVAVALCQEAA